ncbi:MAG: Gfo/Idh/MocA family oxidoreductase [Verrucomicrobiales bacterium]
MKRRRFLASATSVAASGLAFADPAETRRVGVIGHTGRGNYGHGLDTVWLNLPDAEIAGVADPDSEGLKKELGKLKLGGDEGFSDYRTMLAEVKPEFVAVCSRHADQHRDMCLAAIEAGARGIYVEKPFVRTPREADEVIAAAEKAGTKIAVAHRNRYHPALATIDRFMAEGKLGKLLEIRGRGKGDRRGGAEDLWVLGTHVLNLVHYFGGEPETCSAAMLDEGESVTRDDVVPDGSEGLGPLAGDELHARYAMSGGVVATFDSIANDGTAGHGFGLVLVGSEGVINIRADRDPVAHFLAGNPFEPFTEPKAWRPITSAGVGEKETQPEVVAEVRNHVAAVRDLIEAVDEDREPLCSARDAAVTVEMVCAVFESHRQEGKAVAFPLAQRENALTRL